MYRRARRTDFDRERGSAGRATAILGRLAQPAPSQSNRTPPKGQSRYCPPDRNPSPSEAARKPRQAASCAIASPL